MSPIETMLLTAIATLSAAIAFLYKGERESRKNQIGNLEKTVAKLDKRVDIAQAHFDECDRDRKNIREELRRQEELINQFRKCTNNNCPIRPYLN